MSTAGRPDPVHAPADVATHLREADFIRLVAAPDGDALAATGLLGRALAAVDIPFHVSVQSLPEPGSTEAPCTIGLGHDVGDCSLGDPCVSQTAFAVAQELGHTPDPVLALVGETAAGQVPGETGDSALAAAREDGRFERRPGVGVPTEDLADGLAHSTLFHATFSGTIAGAEEVLTAASVDGEVDHRRLASLVAVHALENAPDRAASAVERALRPWTTAGPFQTVAGFGDVLEATARHRPGTAVALALGHGGREPALDAWRDHATLAHTAVRKGDLERLHGLVIARVDGAVQTVARLVRDFRSPEPVAVAICEDEVAIATTDRDAGRLAADGAAAAGGRGSGRTATGYAAIEDVDAFLEALRGAL